MSHPCRGLALRRGNRRRSHRPERNLLLVKHQHPDLVKRPHLAKRLHLVQSEGIISMRGMLLVVGKSLPPLARAGSLVAPEVRQGTLLQKG